MFVIFITFAILRRANAHISPDDLQYLNELSLDKLLKIKDSLQELVTTKYDNITLPSPVTPNIHRFGAQAMAVKGPPLSPIKRTDYEDGLLKKGDHSKISSIFSMSVSTLAFLAFGGYLLCLIVQAMKSKQGFDATVTQPTFFVSAGIKKRPQPQIASYGRRRRDNRRYGRSLNKLSPSPEQLYSALLQLCEGYVKWSKKHEVL